MATDLDYTEDTGSDNDDLRALRAKAKKADKLEAELTELRRERAFVKAGINPEDPKMKYFIRGYDGDDDPDAIREAATEAGFLAAEPEQTPQQAEAQETQQRMDQAQAGAPGIQPPAPLSRERMEEVMAEGGQDALLALLETEGIPTN